MLNPCCSSRLFAFPFRCVYASDGNYDLLPQSRILLWGVERVPPSRSPAAVVMPLNYHTHASVGPAPGTPAADKLKRSVCSMLEDYISSGDISDALATLQDIIANVVATGARDHACFPLCRLLPLCARICVGLPLSVSLSVLRACVCVCVHWLRASVVLCLCPGVPAGALAVDVVAVEVVKRALYLSMVCVSVSVSVSSHGTHRCRIDPSASKRLWRACCRRWRCA